MANRHFYQVNIYGDPIQGSNVTIKNKPRTFGAGQRWVEFISKGESFPCCTDGPLVITSLGKKTRYYVRLRNQEMPGAVLTPIPGTLMKHTHKPPTGVWQEIIGRYVCETVPQWNATYDMGDDAGPTDLDLAVLLNLSGTTFVALTESGDNFDVELDTDGTLTVENTGGVDAEESFTFQYETSDGCLAAFQMTFVYTA